MKVAYWVILFRDIFRWRMGLFCLGASEGGVWGYFV